MRKNEIKAYNTMSKVITVVEATMKDMREGLYGDLPISHIYEMLDEAKQDWEKPSRSKEEILDDLREHWEEFLYDGVWEDIANWRDEYIVYEGAEALDDFYNYPSEMLDEVGWDVLRAITEGEKWTFDNGDIEIRTEEDCLMEISYDESIADAFIRYEWSQYNGQDGDYTELLREYIEAEE